ncbi:enoyl-CoA hydratase/isomerase family protein [Ottowia sp. VDI28]|uniref:enoyl-CoA hydratase/isomerase family protein n=1 Tax=Ottowia sp. VDI28 TaxID=3133968 RepID=UPI003C2D7B37
MNAPETIALETHGPVRVIALNRPEKRNALDMAAREHFASAVQQAMEDEQVKAIVITGRGGHFCAGGDISNMQGSKPMTAEAGRARMRRTLQNAERLYSGDKIVVAAVEGSAYGGGFGLALLADLVIAAKSARFCMSFSRIGLVPDNASMYTLPRIVGLQRAKEIMLSAREVHADEARELGIAMEVVSDGEALQRAIAIAQGVATASSSASAMTKAALNRSFSSDLATMVELESAAQGIAFSSEYHRDAVERFIQRQPAKFNWPTPE